MFHTFQASAPASANSAAPRNSPKSRRQSSTAHACEECRRRKIRCDGEFDLSACVSAILTGQGKKPCSHCEWYKHPELCRYSKKQPRVVPSQRLLDGLSTALKQSQKALEQLFPNTNLTQLGDLPRGELVELINSTNANTPSSSASPRPSSGPRTPGRIKPEDSSSNLDMLEQEPSPDANWNEAKTGPSGVSPVSAHVNALNMSASSQSSYLGVSSIAAALRVISKINKALEHVIIGDAARHDDDDDSSDVGSSKHLASDDEATAIATPVLSEAVLVDAYFNHVHPFIPMVDETRFRSHFQNNNRTDEPWLALLNMVLAMGTIAAFTAEDNSHLLYYQRAKQCVDIDMLGNGQIETVQALGLMGGLYLHYISRPNMANAIMGAALRMACALGLHREYAGGPMESRPDFIGRALLIPREVRRRTWWSLFCLDTWATTTTGRPSLGRISSAVTVFPPSFLGNPPDCSKPGTIDNDDDTLVIILCHETSFCKIATRIQDRLAEKPLLSFEETARFDAELQN